MNDKNESIYASFIAAMTYARPSWSFGSKRPAPTPKPPQDPIAVQSTLDAAQAKRDRKNAKRLKEGK